MTPNVRPSLGMRIARWLVDNPAGGGLRDILAAMPEGTKRPVVASSLATLIRADKARATKRPGERYQHYTAGPYALTDRRRKENQTLAAPAKPARKPKVKREKPAKMTRPLSTVTVPAPIKLPARTAQADDVSADVKAFLKAGGRIQRLPIGASANPLTHCGHRAVNEATWREREAVLATKKPNPETPMKDQPEPLSGPDFLDACADSNAASGLDVNAAEFRRRANQWREEERARLQAEASLAVQTAAAREDAALLDFLADRTQQIANVTLPTWAVLQNLDSLRAAIRAVMDQAKAGEQGKDAPTAVAS